MIHECVVVLTTIGVGSDAEAIAQALVEERLAACVNVHRPMRSTYRWKGDVERARERQMVIKTTADRVAALKTRLHQLHSYEVPEFLVLPVVDGSEPYLAWIRDSTTDD